MGLFSFPGKNKQDSSGPASGRFSRDDDDALAERARAKRASHAGAGRRKGGDDPVLPEKKRARRRLVGAIALALAAAMGLPMLLDSEPKPLAGDIAIHIPSKEKAPPLPAPADPVPVVDAPAVAADESVDKGEEIIAAPPAPSAADERDVAEVKAAPAKSEPAKPEPAKPEPAKPEPKAAKAEPKPEARPARPEAPAKAQDDAARALAILEGKEAGKKAEAAGEKYVLQVAALGSQEKVAELQARLREAGIRSFTEKLKRPSGELIRVKVGPFSKDEAEKVRAQLGKLGLSGAIVPA